jgi:ribose 5-phosphate isomerase RpiB
VKVAIGADHAAYAMKQDPIAVLTAQGHELLELVRAFLGASFTHEERHLRRLAKVRALEVAPRPS